MGLQRNKKWTSQWVSMGEDDTTQAQKRVATAHTVNIVIVIVLIIATVAAGVFSEINVRSEDSSTRNTILIITSVVVLGLLAVLGMSIKRKPVAITSAVNVQSWLSELFGTRVILSLRSDTISENVTYDKHNNRHVTRTTDHYDVNYIVVTADNANLIDEQGARARFVIRDVNKHNMSSEPIIVWITVRKTRVVSIGGYECSIEMMQYDRDRVLQIAQDATSLLSMLDSMTSDVLIVNISRDPATRDLGDNIVTTMPSSGAYNGDRFDGEVNEYLVMRS